MADSKADPKRNVLLPAPYDLLWSGISLLFFVGGFFYPTVSGATGFGLPRCVTKSVTTIPCPGCGSGRSLIAFSHGQFLESLAMNPLFALACFFSVLIVLYTISVRLLGMKRIGLPSRGRPIRVAASLLLVANWVFLVAVGR